MDENVKNISYGILGRLIDFGMSYLTTPKKRAAEERIEKIQKVLRTLPAEPAQAIVATGSPDPGISAPQSQKEAPQGEEMMITTQAPVKQPSSVNQAVITREGLDPGTLAYQERKAYNELWLAEGHAKEDFLGCGTDVDCGFKHGLNFVALAQETKSMTTDPVWDEIEHLGQELQEKAHPERVKEQTHHDEYAELAIKISAPRRVMEKRIEARRRPGVTLEEAQKIAAERAIEEIQRRWQQGKR